MGGGSSRTFHLVAPVPGSQGDRPERPRTVQTIWSPSHHPPGPGPCPSLSQAAIASKPVVTSRAGASHLRCGNRHRSQVTSVTIVHPLPNVEAAEPSCDEQGHQGSAVRGSPGVGFSSKGAGNSRTHFERVLFVALHLRPRCVAGQCSSLNLDVSSVLDLAAVGFEGVPPNRIGLDHWV